MTPPPTIATVADALSSLCDTHPGLLDGLARGERALWVGSGVSRDQVPGLDRLLRKVLVFLQGIADAPHRDALERIIENYLADELAAYRADPVAWSVPTDLSALETSYSEILSTEVEGQASDYLLWCAVDVRTTYGSPTLEPGPEHWLIAFLVHEGVVSEVVTTNWDGLLERAVSDSTISGNPVPLAKFMTNESFRTARGRCNLYKAHGCAILACEDEMYREYLVAATADIAKWPNNPIYAGMVERLRLTARLRKSLMLGLSVQDYNLLTQIAAASEDLPWAWDPNDPPYVFAELAVKPSQRDVLQLVYKTEYTPNRAPITSLSVAGMYSGLLLAAATLHVLIEKFQIAVEHAPAFAGSGSVIESLREGLGYIGAYVADVAGGDLDRLVILIRRGLSSLVLHYFNPGTELVGDEYKPFYSSSLKAGVDEQFRDLDLPALSVAVGLLGFGAARNYWRLTIGTGDAVGCGIVQMVSNRAPATSPVKIVVTRDWRSTDTLKSTDLWANDPSEVMVIQATGDRVPTRTRGVSGGLGSGRMSKKSRREILISDLEPYAGAADTLIDAFRAEVSA